ncbi:hypothetical protein ACJIZ3_014494 [Penstemon smallii]|uniref:Cupin type-1 domain-containing protein n=1 Tax=Penstemon smallii TaxID=265156 RepID=A0ABD3RN63_9LAMI
MLEKMSLFLRFVIVALFLLSITITSAENVKGSGPVVKKEERTSLVSNENGAISAVRVSDNINGSYLLHFFTLGPNALFLPVILHADMVFYVHAGSGKLSWTDEDELKTMSLRRGDVYRLEQGSVFFLQSNSETEIERANLRIHAIFANSNDDLREPRTGPYSSIREMVLGFDKNILQATFKVPEEVIDELLNGTRQPAIVHGAVVGPERTAWDLETEFIRGVIRTKSFNLFELNKKKKKDDAKLFNLFDEDKDFENCNGWITAVARKKLSALKGSNFGLFMVNLTIGSMMAPHWNPMATEIGIVLQGRGMVRVVCSSFSNETTLCRNMRFEVKEGDVFVVPKFHTVAQMSFNDDTFVFIGFSTTTDKKNQPQFLVGRDSVLRTLDKNVLALSFNVTNTTMDQLLAPRDESVILGCISCAEGEFEKEREGQGGQGREEEGQRGGQGGEEEAAAAAEGERRMEEEAQMEEEEWGRRIQKKMRLTV